MHMYRLAAANRWATVIKSDPRWRYRGNVAVCADLDQSPVYWSLSYNGYGVGLTFDFHVSRSSLKQDPGALLHSTQKALANSV